jgi:hypothetical protein
MARVPKIAIFVAGLWFVVFVAFAARPTAATQLLSILLSLGFLVFCFISFIRLFTHWRRERWQVVIPLSICLLAVVFAPVVGATMQHVIFQLSLPHYESIIRQMDSGAIPVTPELRRIEQAEGGSVYAVLAQRSTNGVLTVEFLTGGGFPVKHTGFLYCSLGLIEPGSDADSRWRKRREMRPLWYRISD